MLISDSRVVFMQIIKADGAQRGRCRTRFFLHKETSARRGSGMKREIIESCPVLKRRAETTTGC